MTTNIITILTFNTEVLLNLYNYRNISCDNFDLLVLDNDKFNAFNSLFNDIDIACFQEMPIDNIGNVLLGKNIELKLNNLKLLSYAKSHKLTWNICKYLYGDDSYISNVIYLNKNLTNTCNISMYLISEHIITEQRCHSIAIYKNLKIASIHLSGGRFEDKIVIIDLINNTNKQLYNVKLQQIIQLVLIHNPDVICGDFNSRLFIDDEYLNYLLIDIFGKDKSIEIIIYNILGIEIYNDIKNKWNIWIGMNSIINYLENKGYKMVTTLDIDISKKDTTIYGGIVDFIFYKNNKLDIIPDSVEIINNIDSNTNIKSIMNKLEDQTNYIKYDAVLSDHLPIKVSFIIK